MARQSRRLVRLGQQRRGELARRLVRCAQCVSLQSVHVSKAVEGLYGVAVTGARVTGAQKFALVVTGDGVSHVLS